MTTNASRIERKKKKKYKQSKSKRYDDKIKKVKVKVRSEIDLFDWQKWKFHCKDYWIDSTLDKVPRIDYRKVSIDEFIQNYESKNIPVVITHATDDWRAQAHWSEEWEMMTTTTMFI
ncbi:hypothetical protein RMCBS344292_03028 [Rhizopus microsporus]|nr:hypothetical protein RMCBS344292_03028 [Rhizopus microsporus]